MSLLDLTEIADEIEDAEEPTIAENNSEQQLRIISVNGGSTNNKGTGQEAEWFSPVFEVLDAPLMKEFNSFFWVPNKENLSPKQYARALFDIKIFAQAFGIDLTRPLDYEDDLPGCTGWAILGVKKSEEYGEQNTVRKFITPK